MIVGSWLVDKLLPGNPSYWQNGVFVLIGLIAIIVVPYVLWRRNR